MPIIGLVGCGGFGKEVMPLVQEFCAFQTTGNQRYQPYFIHPSRSNDLVLNVPLMSEDDFLGLPVARFFNVAIRNSGLREKIATLFESHGATPLKIVSKHSLQYQPSLIGNGAILGPFSIVEASAQIGQYFHCNMYSYVAHDCSIGDYVTFAPSVRCNGNVVIEDHVYVGCGAIIKDGTANRPIHIGRGAVIGMGAVVTKDVPAGATVVGIPARLINSSPAAGLKVKDPS